MIERATATTFMAHEALHKNNDVGVGKRARSDSGRPHRYTRRRARATARGAPGYRARRPGGRARAETATRAPVRTMGRGGRSRVRWTFRLRHELTPGGRCGGRLRGLADFLTPAPSTSRPPCPDMPAAPAMRASWPPAQATRPANAASRPHAPATRPAMMASWPPAPATPPLGVSGASGDRRRLARNLINLNFAGKLLGSGRILLFPAPDLAAKPTFKVPTRSAGSGRSLENRRRDQLRRRNNDHFSNSAP